MAKKTSAQPRPRTPAARTITAPAGKARARRTRAAPRRPAMALPEPVPRAPVDKRLTVIGTGTPVFGLEAFSQLLPAVGESPDRRMALHRIAVVGSYLASIDDPARRHLLIVAGQED